MGLSNTHRIVRQVDIAIVAEEYTLVSEDCKWGRGDLYFGILANTDPAVAHPYRDYVAWCRREERL